MYDWLLIGSSAASLSMMIEFCCLGCLLFFVGINNSEGSLGKRDLRVLNKDDGEDSMC